MHELAPLAGRVVSASGTDTEVVVAGGGPPVRVETDKRRLERVLGNLVSNAHRHGRPPVVLTVDGPVVTVRDHGDGFPEYLTADGPQRFRTEGGSKGHGLGLTIATGQARVMGAELVFENAPDGGAVARLSLPEYVRLDEEPPESGTGSGSSSGTGTGTGSGTGTGTGTGTDTDTGNGT